MAALQPTSAPSKGRSLVHSIYLDREMLLSFLAVLTDGVALQSDVVDTSTSGSDVKANLIARVAAKLQGFFSSELKASLEARTSESSSGERRETRQYTHASLLNDLRDLLKDDIRLIDAQTEISEDLRGKFVEVTGMIVGNPLEQLLRFYERVLPYVEERPPKFGERVVKRWNRFRSGKVERPAPLS
jgi:hypothetical protein